MAEIFFSTGEILAENLPKLILSRIPVCSSHLNFEDAKHNTLNIIYSAIVSCMYDVTNCERYITMTENPQQHICIRTVLQNYCLHKPNVYRKLI